MDKLSVLKNFETIAALLRKLGLRSITRLGRNALLFLAPDITISVDGLSLSGSILHRGYLWSIRAKSRETYMTQLFKNVCRPGMVVCDIGSYLGYYALLAAQQVGKAGRIYAFEPDPHSFEYLRRNIRDNHFEEVVIPVQKAITDQSGLLNFHICEEDHSKSSLFWREEERRSITVECISLDDFFPTMPQVDVIKMDIEGGEVKALRGMERLIRRSPKVVMFVECNPRALQAAGDSVTQLMETLRGFGFRIAVIDEGQKVLCPVSPEIERVRYVILFCYREGEYG